MRLLARALLAVISVDWQTAIAHLEGRHSALSGRWPLLAPPHYAKGLRHPADHVSGSAGIFSRWRGSWWWWCLVMVGGGDIPHPHPPPPLIPTPPCG